MVVVVWDIPCPHFKESDSHNPCQTDLFQRLREGREHYTNEEDKRSFILCNGFLALFSVL